MYVAPGLLDQRLTFYAHEDAGGDGFARPVYVRTGTFWGRLDITADQQAIGSTPQAQVDVRADAVATVSADVAVDPYGLVRVEGDDTLYHVRGVVRVRQTQAQRLTLTRVQPEESAAFTTIEPIEVKDGYHYGSVNG